MANGVVSTASGSSRSRQGAWSAEATERRRRTSRRPARNARAQGGRGESMGGIEPSSPLPPADVPPSPHGSVFGTDAVCMPPVSAGGMTCPDCDGRGYPVGRSEDKCGFCGGTGHVLRDHK